MTRIFVLFSNSKSTMSFFLLRNVFFHEMFAQDIHFLPFSKKFQNIQPDVNIKKGIYIQKGCVGRKLISLVQTTENT